MNADKGIIRNIVANISPSGGWYHDPETSERLIEAVSKLADLAGDDQVLEVAKAVREIVSAVRNEYGE